MVRQLTPHLHLLVAETMWQADGTVVPVAPPSDEEVARILARVLRAAKKDWADLEAAWPEDDYEELQQRAIQERLGLGEAPAPPRPRRVAVLEGFSLHADTAVHGHDRQGLERLCRYAARGPVAESRLRAMVPTRKLLLGASRVCIQSGGARSGSAVQRSDQLPRAAGNF